MKPSSVLGFLALALPFASAGQPHYRRHQEVANRVRGDVDIHQRNFPNSRLTWYDTGLGACGIWNKPSDWIVALNVEQFGQGWPGPFCFKQVTIVVGGVTAVATITDKCMGCPWGGLDLSPGLFSYFASQDVGVLAGEWSYND